MPSSNSLELHDDDDDNNINHSNNNNNNNKLLLERKKSIDMLFTPSTALFRLTHVFIRLYTCLFYQNIILKIV